MWIRVISTVALWLATAGALSPAHALTRQEIVARLQAAGYSQVSDIKSTAEGTAVEATKNGKELRLVIDSAGQIKERE